jgi:diacylglycerol O-acyltransferase / wax synthase
MALELLSGVDAAWLQMDRPVNTADVVSVIRLDGRLTLPRLRRALEEGLLPHRRFRQRIVAGPLGRPAWEDDPDFSLDRHVALRRLVDFPGALEAHVSAVASTPLDLSRPPWCVDLVHLAGDSALVVKLHHCVADGFALVSVLLSMTDDPDALAPPRRHRRTHAAVRDARSPLALLGAPLDAAAALARIVALPPDASTALKHELSGARRVACTRPIPLRAIRAASRARGVTANTLLGAALAGAVRRWLEEQADPGRGRDVRAIVPVNLRPRGDEASLGNAFGLVFLELPVSAATPDERVATVHARMGRLKSGLDAIVTYNVLGVMGRLPVPAEHRANAFFTGKASLVLTNVPGPRKRLRFAGHEIEHLMFWVPHPASLGLGVSILSYAGEVVIGVRADRAVMPDPAALVGLLEAEILALLPERPRRRERRRHTGDGITPAIVAPLVGAPAPAPSLAPPRAS